MVVLDEGANVPRHAHDGRRVRNRPIDDQLEPVEAENTLSGLEPDRERNEPVAPAGEPLGMVVRIATMALDPNVIQAIVVAELRPSPGVLLSIAHWIPGGTVEKRIEPLEMRHIGARQMQSHKRQVGSLRRLMCRQVRNFSGQAAVGHYHGRDGRDAERRHETMLVPTPSLSHRCASMCHPSSPVGSGNQLFSR